MATIKFRQFKLNREVGNSDERELTTFLNQTRLQAPINSVHGPKFIQLIQREYRDIKPLKNQDDYQTRVLLVYKEYDTDVNIDDLDDTTRTNNAEFLEKYYREHGIKPGDENE